MVHSKLLNFAIVLVTLFWFSCQKKGGLLASGVFGVKYYEKADGVDFKIIIDDSSFTQIGKSGKITRGKIKWYNNFTFGVEGIDDQYDENGLSDKLSTSFGPVCYELSNKNDTIYFRATHLGNLLITLNQGVILKSQ